jgi:glycogen debranching enzyme
MTTQETRQHRPTPADPMPGETTDVSNIETEMRKLPPNLGQDAVAILEGRTFMYSDSVGDIPAGSIGGLVNTDTRLLNKWELTINGARLLNLRSGVIEHYRASFFLTNPKLSELDANTIGIRRQQVIGDAYRERIEVHALGDDRVHVELRLATGNDFADLFEIKERVRDRSAQIVRSHAPDGSRLSLIYRNGDFVARTDVETDPPADRIEGDDLIWDLNLPVGGEWQCDVRIPLQFGPGNVVPPARDIPHLVAVPHDPVDEWRRGVARLTSDSYLIEQLIRTTTDDLAALRILATNGTEEIMLPAAGLPWFLTLFGRDTLITAYQTACAGPALAKGALIALAYFQGREHNEFKDEEPGKILHEVRSGELTQLGITPHNPYYGTADATVLWLILLSEYWRWTGDDELVQTLRENAFAALDWIDLFGDRDGDGYVEYQTRSPQGLGNQCWRDSWDGILYADGTLPPLPIATCEIQGYVYDAKLRLAELADGPLDDPALSRLLRDEAEQLRVRFNEDFWIDRRGGYYALGLDGDKRQIDSLSSNMGQLLWSGIVPPERATNVVRQLMSKEMFSGWGIRTTATSDFAYNPIGYHRGTVWPHDNSLIVMGMTRYGFRAEANRITKALVDAASYTNHRLPEAFSGYPRDYAGFPIPYPTACSPQAWATGAPLLLLRSLLGLEARDGRITLDPDIPEEIGRIAVTGLRAFGTRWDVEAIGRKGHVRLSG